MEQSSVLKSKQLPFWYLSTVVEENRCEGWPRGGAGQRGRACHAPAIRPTTQPGPQLGSSGRVSAAGPATPPPPPSAPRSLGPASAPCPCWDKEPAKGGMQTGHPTSRKCHLHLPVILRGHELPHGKDPLD